MACAVERLIAMSVKSIGGYDVPCPHFIFFAGFNNVASSLSGLIEAASFLDCLDQLSGMSVLAAQAAGFGLAEMTRELVLEKPARALLSFILVSLAMKQSLSCSLLSADVGERPCETRTRHKTAAQYKEFRPRHKY